MGRLVEFPTAGGGTVLVEVTDSVTGGSPDGPTTRGLFDREERVPARADRSIDDALARVRPAADAVLDAVAGLAHAPDEVAVEFGIALTADAGAFIASVGSTASFKVSLRWKSHGAGEKT